MGKPGKSLNILHDFGIDDNTGCYCMSLNEWPDKPYCWLFPLQIGCEWTGIKQITLHTSRSMGGVGVLSWRILSSACSISCQSRSLHAPARSNAIWVASSDTALSAWASSEK